MLGLLCTSMICVCLSVLHHWVPGGGGGVGVVALQGKILGDERMLLVEIEECVPNR